MTRSAHIRFLTRRGLRLGTALAVLTALLTLPVSLTSAQSYQFCRPGTEPTFVLGFAALHAELGDVMGAPMECEHGNPLNGDTLQRTSKGLAFYRAATNVATFTNGSEHWAITQEGLTYWTGDSIDPPGLVVGSSVPELPPLAAPTPTITPTPLPPPPTPAPTVAPLVSTRKQDASAASPAGTPVAPLGPGFTRYGFNIVAHSSLFPAFEYLHSHGESRVLDALSQKNTDVVFASFSGAWGFYSPDLNAVVLNSSLIGSAPETLATLLVHEGTHAEDFHNGRLGTSEGCFQSEKDGAERAATFWRGIYGLSGKSIVSNVFEEELNRLVVIYEEDQDEYEAYLEEAYKHQCER
jgi:hypothetical protein